MKDRVEMRRIAKNHLNLKEFKKAILLYRTVIKMSEPDPDLYNDYAHCLLFDGQLERAMVNIKLSLKLDPDAYISWLTKGQIHAKMGEYTRTIACFERARSYDVNLQFVKREILETFSWEGISEYLFKTILNN